MMNAVSVALPASAPMTSSRLLRAYWAEARHEIMRTLRTPAFVVPTVALPVLLYLFFGIVLAGSGHASADPQVGLYTLSGFVMFSVIGPGLFGLGIGFAIERQSGIVTLKRALPMPPAANLVGKLFSSMALSLIVITILISMAIFTGRASLSALQVAKFMTVSVLGVAPFCALGLLIGTLVSGTAAPAVVNLIYFPMIYLSGLFPFPLPKAMQMAARVWPAFHLNQLSLAALGLKTAIDVRIAVAVLVVFTAVCMALAARRLARVG
jgi:ABC-2 type transport system permease protein